METVSILIKLKKKLTISSAGVEELDLSYIAGGNTEW